MEINITSPVATENTALPTPENTYASFAQLPVMIRNTDVNLPEIRLIPVDPFAGIKSKIPLPADIFNKAELRVSTISDNEKLVSCSWTENVPAYLPEHEDNEIDDNGLYRIFNNDSKCDISPGKGRMNYVLTLSGQNPEPLGSDVNFKQMVSPEHALRISQIAHQGHCASVAARFYSLTDAQPYIPVQVQEPANIHIEQTGEGNYTITSGVSFLLKNPDHDGTLPDLRLRGERVTQFSIDGEQPEYDIIRLTILHKQPAETLLLPKILLSE